MKTKSRITPQQIVDDFFHEYQEGRLDRDGMVDTILRFAKQYADERDAWRDEDDDDIIEPYAYDYLWK